MSSPQLGVTHITEAQENKETTANAAFDQLDNACNALLSVAISGDTEISGANFTNNFFFRLTGTPGTAFTVSVPVSERFFAVQNLTDSDATIEALNAGTDAVTISAGASRVLFCDGSDITPFGAESSGGGGGVEVQP